MAAAAVLAVTLAFLLVGISYILFPEQTSQQPTPMPTSKPEPLAEQIVWAIGWIGLAACITSAIVGAMLLLNRMNRREMAKTG